MVRLGRTAGVLTAGKRTLAMHPPSSDNTLGLMLRTWRARRGRSQLALSLDLGVSQRHISFIESGRSAPSRSLLTAISKALDVPFRDRNDLLLAAGFAPVYSDRAWDAAEMRAVHKALERMLRQHEPFPAIVMDRYWNVLMANESAPRFFGRFIDMSARPGQRNLLRLLFDPNGMRPFIANWEQVARGLLERISRESVGGVIDEKTTRLMTDLLAYPGLPLDLRDVDTPGAAPVVAVGFIEGDRVRSYFSMVSTVGTPQTVAAQELRVECMFPADDETEAWHLRHFSPSA